MPDALPSAERTNSATIEGLLLYEAGQRDGEVLATKRIVAWARTKALTHHRLAVERKDDRDMRHEHLSLSRAYSTVADEIERGEHEEAEHA